MRFFSKSGELFPTLPPSVCLNPLVCRPAHGELVPRDSRHILHKEQVTARPSCHHHIPKGICILQEHGQRPAGRARDHISNAVPGSPVVDVVVPRDDEADAGSDKKRVKPIPLVRVPVETMEEHNREERLVEENEFVAKGSDSSVGATRAVRRSPSLSSPGNSVLSRTKRVSPSGNE